MIRRTGWAALAAALALTATACSGETNDSASTVTVPEVTANTQAPVSVPPLGPDVACTDPMHCQLRNPEQLSDEQWIERLASVPGGTEPPAEQMRPWAFVVLNLGEEKTDARDKPSDDADVVGDQYRILNHRVLFAYCRTAASDPHDAWYLIEPITDPAPEGTWISGEYLYAYGHDGAIPTC
ncbi:hypothetical protein ACTQ49_07550 [Luteococcus sp. Sow4_B9]|uniref:hypothetical protein n=1 Tax=Luteococcus sp. Sow4_B9 TaxID=3438792 RepID=UPI003F9B7AD5